MGSIDLLTAQNILIKAELASPGQRVAAFILDFVVLILATILVSATISSTGKLGEILIYFIFGFYHILMESLNKGQSLGKYILGIKVTSLSGQTPSFESLLLRWCFRLVDIGGSVGSVALVSIISTPNNQRLGDSLAGTIVIRKKAQNTFTLDQLFNISKNDDLDNIKYPQLRHYTDKEFLLIKDVMNRYSKFPTIENKKLLDTLTSKLCSDLGIPLPDHNYNFLAHCLREYVILSR